MRSSIFVLSLFLATTLGFGSIFEAHAAGKSAEPNPADVSMLATIQKSGAKLYYLGTRNSLDGWLIVKDGRVQIAYSTADKHALLIGALFGESGENITGAQVKVLLENNKDIAALLTNAAQEQQAMAQAGNAAPVPAANSGGGMAGLMPSVAVSPGERLVQDLTGAAGVTIGSGGPKLFMVMDPNCPHCQATWHALRDAVFKKQLQIRMIPIGDVGGDDERAAAILLRATDPLNAWNKYVGTDKGPGDKAQLAGMPDPNAVKAVQTNHALVDSWTITQTPYMVYRGKDGKVKIVEGEPSQLSAMLADMAP